MPKFELQNIEAVKGKQKFEQLSIDGNLVLTEFEKDLNDTTYKAEFFTLTTYMNHLAELRSLPKTKFRELYTKKNDSVKEYEIKTKHLRLFLIKTQGGKIVVFGGYKNSQDEDIVTFRGIKKQYLDSIKPDKK